MNRPSGGFWEPPGASGSSWRLTVLLQVDSEGSPLVPNRHLPGFSRALLREIRSDLDLDRRVSRFVANLSICSQDAKRRQSQSQTEPAREPDRARADRDRADRARQTDRFPDRGRTAGGPRTAGPAGWLFIDRQGRRLAEVGLAGCPRSRGPAGAASGAKRRERVAEGPRGSRTGATRG